MAETLISVSETFKSIQGEGPTMGKPSYFLRLTGCNLVCGGKGSEKDGLLHNGAEWRCDTIEVWMKGTKKKIPDIFKMLGGDKFTQDMNCNCGLVVTGGEPLLQQRSLKTFFKKLRVEAEFIPHVEIETNGTIPPDPELFEFVTQWNVSPKLKNSGVEWNDRFSRAAMYALVNDVDACFKFVVSDYSDWLEVLTEWMVRFDIPGEKVWLMPAAETRAQLIEVSEEIANICRDHSINFSARLHLLCWDKKTGV